MLTVVANAPHVDQAHLPSRTLAFAPHWGAWQSAMRDDAFNIRGLSSSKSCRQLGPPASGLAPPAPPDARAARIGIHAELYGLELAAETYPRGTPHGHRPRDRLLSLSESVRTASKLHLQITSGHVQLCENPHAGISPLHHFPSPYPLV
eukprot:Skav210715  [mRNA]  locus=scaffold1582:498061:498507:+ [translate_table: standard]